MLTISGLLDRDFDERDDQRSGVIRQDAVQLEPIRFCGRQVVSIDAQKVSDRLVEDLR